MEAEGTFILNFLSLFFSLFLTKKKLLLNLPLTLPPFLILAQGLRHQNCPAQSQTSALETVLAGH